MHNISLVTLTKNVDYCIGRMISSVSQHVKEIVVIDTYSTDNTIKVIKDIRPDVIVLQKEFDNFSSLLNFGIKHTKQDWILVLDADETIIEEDWKLFGDLFTQTQTDGYRIPRKHWQELEMKNWYQEEHWYPNYADRLFKNNGVIQYKNYVHPVLIGCKELIIVPNQLHIQHFNRVYNTPEIIKAKETLYHSLLAQQERDTK